MRPFKEIEDELYRLARRELLDGLALCTNGQQRKFQRVHANGNMELSIEQVVARIPRGKLASAMRVVLHAVKPE